MLNWPAETTDETVGLAVKIIAQKAQESYDTANWIEKRHGYGAAHADYCRGTTISALAYEIERDWDWKKRVLAQESPNDLPSV